MSHPMRRAQHVVLALVILISITTAATWAVPRTWIGGNSIWSDGTGSGNWDPSGEPGLDDDAIFSSANAVTLGTANTIQLLTMSNGIGLNTGGFNLTANGTVSLSDANTQLVVSGSTSHLKAFRLDINSGASVTMQGGSITIDRDVNNGFLDVNSGGMLIGNGTISLLDAVSASAILIANDGTISARSEPLVPFTAPPAGMLLITAPSSNARIDLDGSGSNGVWNVFQNQTIKITLSPFDPFDGDVNLYHNSTFESVAPWSLNTGLIHVATGAVPASLPNPAIPADVAYLSGGTLTQTGGTIHVIDSDGALQFNAPFIKSGGSLQINGRVIINSNSRISAGTVSGGGSFVIGNNGTLAVDHGVSLDVRVQNQGAFSPGGNTSVVHLSMDEFEQTASGRLYMQLSSATVGDKLLIDGPATFGGELRIGRVDPVIPVPGASLTTIEYLSYSGGTFTIINDTGLAGLSLTGSYGSTSFSLIAGALISGDADLNGRVDARDLVRLANHWLSNANWLGGDFDGDGFVDQDDLTILAQNWQAGVLATSFAEVATDLGLPGSSVPEPSAVLLAVFGFLCFPNRRRR